MSIPAENIHKAAFWRETAEADAIEKYYTWEVSNYGEASSNTKAMRHYWLSKLLERQLREFNHG